MSISERINRIGIRLVKCRANCEGVYKNPTGGVIPRGLFLEQRDIGKLGCVVAGLNPARVTKFELDNLEGDICYEQMLTLWHNKICKIAYYKRLRCNIISSLGIKGTILWTDLIKCENGRSGDSPSEKTFQTCMGTWLNQELDAVPPGWPIIAVGRKTYDRLRGWHSVRKIVGIYHPKPTGNFGYWRAMVEELASAHLTIDRLLSDGRQIIWLPDYLNAH